MRTYVVQPGDSPASIAAQEHHAACPKCSVDLIRANPQKSTIVYPNGFVSFRDLRAGESLWLPEKWFDGTLDRMPREYFASLPYADGVTPGVGQAATPSTTPQPIIEVIGAAQAVGDAIAADPNYCASVSQPGSAVNKAVHEFKVAWNAANPDDPVPMGTGTIERETVGALTTVLGNAAPISCSSTTPPPQPLQTPAPIEKKGLSTGAVVGIGLGAALLAGGVTYAATRKPSRKPSRRRRRR